ncbi:MAG: PDZ domain-containing protein, partial [Planctomycetota bacterium]
MKTAAAVLALLVLFLSPASGQEVPIGRSLVQAALAADGEQRAEAVEALLAVEDSVDRVAGWFAEGRDYGDKIPTGWLEKTVIGSDGVERAYLLHVPKDYDPAKRYRMVVDMHGGVSRPKALTHAELGEMKFFWGAPAEKGGWILALPAGQKGAEWWTEVGAGNVLSILRETKRCYNVNEDLVFATGFSDGGSGSFYMALAHPTPFAGFIPLSGHVGVARLGGLQVHLKNLQNKPLYITNTEKDSLYPSAGVKPLIDAMKRLAVDVVWRDIPEFTHNPMYLPDERPKILDWMREFRRDPHPTFAAWEGAAGAPCRVHWLTDVKVGGEGSDDVFPDVNPMLTSTRIQLGITVDQAFAGPGAKVDTVAEESAAEEAALKPGDVIVTMDGAEIGGLGELRTAIRKKKPGDAFTLVVQREGKNLDLSGTFPKPQPRPAFPREAPFGTVDVRRHGQVFAAKTNRVTSFALLLSPDFVDFAMPVKVVVNDEVVFDAVVKPDLKFLVTQALEDEDRRLIYAAK